MKISSIILLLLFSIFAKGQQTKQWLENIETPKYDIDKLKKENLKEKYLQYDFSTLLSPRSEFLGYIGSDFRRLKIFFTALSKNQTDPNRYDIKGFSLVGVNKCDLTGIITITQIREFKYLHLGADDIYKDSSIISQGLLIGNFELKEDSTQSNSGVMKGIMTLSWYLGKSGIIHYDDIEYHSSDRYCNNQYVGTWIDYNKHDGKVSNWGEYRIPFSGDLDIGAGEFSPNKKYSDKGWHDYHVD